MPTYWIRKDANEPTSKPKFGTEPKKSSAKKEKPKEPETEIELDESIIEKPTENETENPTGDEQ